MNIEQLVNEFESQTLNVSEWNHISHIRIALWYLYNEKDFFKAVQRIRCGFIRYGTNRPAELCYSKYHETKTIFFLLRIANFICDNNKKSFAEIEFLILQDQTFFDKEYILKYYSKEKIESQKAQSIFVLPDSLRYLIWGYTRPSLVPFFIWAVIIAFSFSSFFCHSEIIFAY